MNEPNEGGYDRHEVREPNGPRGGYVVSDRSPGGSLTHSIPHGPSSPLYLRRLRPVTEGNGSEESEKPRNEGPKVDSRTERKQIRRIRMRSGYTKPFNNLSYTFPVIPLRFHVRREDVDHLTR